MIGQPAASIVKSEEKKEKKNGRVVFVKINIYLFIFYLPIAVGRSRYRDTDSFLLSSNLG